VAYIIGTVQIGEYNEKKFTGFEMSMLYMWDNALATTAVNNSDPNWPDLDAFF